MIRPKKVPTRRDENRNYGGEAETGGANGRYQTFTRSIGKGCRYARRGVRLGIADLTGTREQAERDGEMAASDWKITRISP